MTLHRASCRRSFPTKLEFTRQQMLKASIVHDEHYKIHTLYTDLQSPTPATN
jgi:hypothetical protein